MKTLVRGLCYESVLIGLAKKVTEPTKLQYASLKNKI